MARRSLVDRFEELEGRREVMEADRVQAASVSPVHVAMIDVLSNMLTMGNQFATDKVPAPLRAMMRTLDMMKPTLIEELSRIPAENIVPFMAGLRDQMDDIVKAGGGIGSPGPMPDEELPGEEPATPPPPVEPDAEAEATG